MGSTVQQSAKERGRLRVSEEQKERIYDGFTRRPFKSTRRASRQLDVPQTLLACVKKAITQELHKFSLVQALTNDKVMRRTFCESMLEMLKDDETLFSRLVFRDEVTFHLCGKVNRHSVGIWGTHHPNEAVDHKRDLPKVNVMCAVSRNKVIGPFFFEKNTVTGPTYFEMLQNWLFTVPQADSNDLILQQNGAMPHWHLRVRAYLNQKVL